MSNYNWACITFKKTVEPYLVACVFMLLSIIFVN